MSRGLLDTSVIIAHADEVPLEALPEEGAVSVATLAELHYGVLVARDDETRRHRLVRVGLVEASFEPIPIDAAVARAFARVAHTVKRAGRRPRARVMDLWIAATALSQGLTLYTRDRDGFAPLGEVIEIKVV